MSAKIVRLREMSGKANQAYRFIDRDPIIEDLLFCMDGSDMTDAQIAARAMCSWQTVHNVRTKTKRPQNYTVDRILKACGFRRAIIDRNNNIIKTR